MALWKEQRLNEEYQRRLQQQAEAQRQRQQVQDEAEEAPARSFFRRKRSE